MAVREHGLFRRVESPGPDVAKGGCYYSGDCGPGVDTGILVEFEGTLFFSLQAIREMAEVAGFSLNAEGVKLEADLANALRAVEVLTAEKAELVDQLNAIGIAVARAAEAS